VTGDARPVEVVLVEAPACHLCDGAARVLAEAACEHRLVVRRVDLASEEGRAIVRAHRAPMPPVVLFNGELLGWGRLSRGRLRQRLADLDATAAR
jgi:predicted DCC family thiol-disulfide oxidoreductase YuxK